MFQQTFAIIRNTFYESIRQPIMLVILAAATILLIMSNPLSAFTMADDQRMLIDIGLATVFLCGALLAAFIATNVLGREIENRTALTVISKPVSRPIFVLGKFIGVAAALMLGTIYMSLVFMLVEQHTVLQTVRDPIHLPVILFGFGAAIIGVGTGIWCNYFYGKVFSSTVICVTTPLAALAYIFSMMFKADFALQPIAKGFKPELWLALIALMVAIMVLTAIAVAASTRLGQVMTLSITVGLFVLGMLSDWLFGQRIASLQESWLKEASAAGKTEWVERVQKVHLTNQKRGDEINTVTNTVEVSTVPLKDFATQGQKIEYALCWVGYTVLPNFQALWLSDAVTQNHKIPPRYIATTSLYGGLYILAMLSLATLLFQRREVG
jgi:ABC-2 type transport system permease protein